MAYLLVIAALWVGLDAADKLNHPHPTPVAWFEAAVTCVCILGAVVLVAVGRADD